MESIKGSSAMHLDLQLKAQQTLHLQQHLMMSQHMQQALHILQLPLIELEAFIEEQLASNPLLEIISEEEEEPINDQDFTILRQLDEEGDEEAHAPIRKSIEEDSYRAYLEQSISNEVSLHDSLIQQAHDSFETQQDLNMAEILIGYIESTGFLHTSLAEIAELHQWPEQQLRGILKEIQTFEPYGIGASSIQESLLIQLRCLHKEHTLAYQIIDHYYEDFLHNRLPLIQKNLKQPLIEIQKAINQHIAKLDLHPGSQRSRFKASLLIADVTLRQEGDQLFVDTNRDYIPHLRLNHHYLKLLDDPEATKETKQFIRHHIFSARWLMRNLQQRYSTVERIAQFLAQQQREFFTEVEGKLVPLTMKVVAEELQLHESTIARTVSNKYMDSPKGLMPLKSFFTTAYISEEGEDLSAKTIQDAIVDLINQEDKSQPLSDEKICFLLKNRGIKCARRTIAKYRSYMRIGKAQQRKKFI
jgi:RNA polymerase sigma-54 factor